MLTMPAFRDCASPDPALVRRLVESGWVGQPWRGYARVAIAVDSGGMIQCVSAEGRDNLNALDFDARAMLRKVFRPSEGRNVYFALRGRRPGDTIWLMDCLRHEGKDNTTLSFDQRWALIPRAFISPKLKLATPLRSSASCWEATAHGQVLMRNPTAWGWFSSSSLILRSRANA